jgi:alpha-tubulin suppressor-like RCC1 family protein
MTGAPSFTPVTVSGVSGLIGIAAGGNDSGEHTCAATSGAAVWCWGSNNGGVLGNGTTNLPEAGAGVPVTVPGLSGATAVISGQTYSCALLSNGTVECWGQTYTGQNGLSPAVVPGLSGGVQSISGSDGRNINSENACAQLADGTVKCWGVNTWGELGDGTTTTSQTAVVVKGVSGASAIAAGGTHSCAVVAGGAVQCWGDNSQGELGVGILGKPDAGAPMNVSGLTGAIAVSAGQYFSCAILSSGEVDCWGQNSFGQLGNGTTSTTPSATPAPVAW